MENNNSGAKSCGYGFPKPRFKKNLIVGLTGGIACGKTTVANMLRSFGAHVIDADLIGHQVLKDDPYVKDQILAAFGRCVLDDKGEIDRSKLGCIVFNNPVHLHSLNELIHPRIIELIKADIDQKSSAVENSVIVIDAALLIELNLTYLVDLVLLVHADEDIQMRRLMQRGLPREDAQKRIQSQMPPHEKARFADFIIYTNGPISNTKRQAKQVWEAMNSVIRKS